MRDLVFSHLGSPIGTQSIEWLLISTSSLAFPITFHLIPSQSIRSEPSSSLEDLFVYVTLNTVSLKGEENHLSLRVTPLKLFERMLYLISASPDLAFLAFGLNL